MTYARRVQGLGPLRHATRLWAAGRSVPVRLILASLRRGSGDPTYAERDGVVWRAMGTPDGPVTLALPAAAPDGRVVARAWGSGADWALERVPAMLGDADDPAGFAPAHPALSRAWRRHGDVRVPSTGLVFESVLAAVLEQKVTGHEAWYAWRELVRGHGQVAPGPDDGPDLFVPPSAATVRSIPSWAWRRLSVDHARSSTIIRAAQRAGALERTVAMPSADAERGLRSIPGIGVWTAAEVRQRAHGDCDAVSFGDYHLSARVGLLLAARRFDDAAMAEALEPYRPHRYRVQRLVEIVGDMPARRGPRMSPRTHLPTPRNSRRSGR